MTLARRMVYKIVALVASLLLLGGVAVWGLRASGIAARIAGDEYTELRMILDVDEQLLAARGLLTIDGDRKKLVQSLTAAARRVDEFDAFQDTQHKDIETHEEEEGALLRSVRAQLSAITERVGGRVGPLEPDVLADVIVQIDDCLRSLGLLAAEMDETIATAHDRSNRTLLISLGVQGAMIFVIVVATTLINVAQYQSVVRPLRRIRDAVRRIATGHFADRLDVQGDREFAELSNDLNRMAAQLDELYRDLETKVRTTSRELARSERLASVGYLASGVAHEISNPLNIISGYAELTLKQLRKEEGDPSRTQEALRIIRDESFRCKEIIEKLLTLSAKGDKARHRVCLGHVADEVASMLGSLRHFSGRRIHVECADSGALDVLGDENELKQVMLNLTVNALSAVEAGVGVVRIRGTASNGTVQVQVADNGRGMAREVLDHVFEPFFTTRRGSEGRGVGLGLSITHAIVESHGGTLTAASEGPGKGSTFTIRLPSFSHETGV